MNFEGPVLSGENFDVTDTTQIFLPENFLGGRNDSSRMAGTTKIGGKIDQMSLSTQVGDIVVKNKGRDYAFSSANGMLIDENTSIQFYGISLGRLAPGSKMPMTVQIRGIASIMNHSDVVIKPGDLLQLKTPDSNSKRTPDGRYLFLLIPYDESYYLRSITKTNFIDIIKDEHKFGELFNMQLRLDYNKTNAIKTFRSVLASAIPILSFLDQIGLITINLTNQGITNFITSINRTSLNTIFQTDYGNLQVNGQLSVNAPRTKQILREHVDVISKLFNVDGKNDTTNYSIKFLNFLMARFFTEDKSIAYIGGAKDPKLEKINNDIQSLREGELSIKTGLLRDKVVAKATKKALPGQELKILF